MTDTPTVRSPSNGYVSVDSSRLYYEIAGDGPGLILLHAGIADARMWDQQFLAFAKHFTVLRYDLAGFGRSELPVGQYAHYLQLARLLELFELDQVALVGVSMGGTLALEFTVAFPQKVSRVVLSGAGVGFTERSAERTRRTLEINEALEQGDVDLANELELRMWVDGPQRSPEDIDPGVRNLVSEMNIQLLRSIPDEDLEYDLDPPVTERISEVACPVLMLNGELDMPDVHAAATLLETSLPDVISRPVSGAAHMVSMERPDEFNRRTMDFLRN